MLNISNKNKVVSIVEYTLHSRNVIFKQKFINRYLPLLFMDSSLSWLQNFSTATYIQCFVVQLHSIICNNYYSKTHDVQWKSTYIIRMHHIQGERVTGMK
jgi:hypothetical protein